VAEPSPAGRPNQRRRTRKDLLQAAARLTSQGRKPSLEEVAEAALVSRATAYRYFPSIEALLVEAALDLAFPENEAVFAGASATDPVDRLLAADAAMAGIVRAHEPSLRLMLSHAVRQGIEGAEPGLPARQNRRTPLIEAALGPRAGDFDPEVLERLKAALALIIGTEAMVVFKDVLQIDDASADAARHWAIRALMAAALDQSGGGD
jgi:AcrR family transcriptional regulator